MLRGHRFRVDVDSRQPAGPGRRADYIAAYEALYPLNPRAIYLQAEGSPDRIACGQVRRAVEGILRNAGGPA
jgi:hypothetical protein